MERISLAQFIRLTDAVDPLDRAISHWEAANKRLVSRYFGSAGDGLHGESVRLEKNSYGDGDRWGNALDKAESGIRQRIGVLESLLDRVGRPAETTVPEMTDLSFVRYAGLLEAAVVDSLEKRLGGLKDRRNVPRVVAASKELVEAVNRASIERLGGSWQKTDDFTRTGKTARRLLKEHIDRNHAAVASVEQTSMTFLTGLSTLDLAMATFRNDVGEGHGRPSAPVGLDLRHAHLARDTALAYTRYVVRILGDLGIP